MMSHLEDVNFMLSEVRKKLAYIAIVFLAGASISFPLTGFMIERIRLDLLPEGATVVYVAPLEVMMLKLKMTLILALMISSPLIIFFALKAIINRFNLEIRIKAGSFWIIVSFIAILFMFILGVAYSYFIMLPFFIKYLFLNADASGVVATYSIFKFISFVFATTIIFGLIFDMPLLMIFLIRKNIIPYRAFIQYRKHLYVSFFVLAALLTPPDVISQIMIGLPLIAFFEISLVIAKILGGRQKTKKDGM
ncbi:twin-arginine translocase subunit TatC [Methanolobus sp. WCC4]|uniref:twin-arginine translocase subunit TatC n=1 Tax=Methanolobus sp. WCC4 TaxID=3125784 RepID=UPI0030F663C6